MPCEVQNRDGNISLFAIGYTVPRLLVQIAKITLSMELWCIELHPDASSPEVS